MNVKDKVSTFNIILHITIDGRAVGTTDRNIRLMSTVVSAPASVTTVENASLWSGTRYIIKPDLSCSRTVSVSQCPSKPVKNVQTNYVTNIVVFKKGSEARNNDHRPSYLLQTHNDLSFSTTRTKSPPDMSRTSRLQCHTTQTTVHAWITTGCDGRCRMRRYNTMETDDIWQKYVLFVFFVITDNPCN